MQVNLDVNPDVFEQFQKYCERKDRSVNWVLNVLMMKLPWADDQISQQEHSLKDLVLHVDDMVNKENKIKGGIK